MEIINKNQFNYMVILCMLLMSIQTLAQIRNKVDTAYLYEYEKTRFVPPAGKTLLVLGQSKTNINECRENFLVLMVLG